MARPQTDIDATKQELLDIVEAMVAKRGAVEGRNAQAEPEAADGKCGKDRADERAQRRRGTLQGRKCSVCKRFWRHFEHFERSCCGLQLAVRAAREVLLRFRAEVGDFAIGGDGEAELGKVFAGKQVGKGRFHRWSFGATDATALFARKIQVATVPIGTANSAASVS